MTVQHEPSASILVVGEVLWDALPQGLFLGGAPLNVACHLHTLGECVAFASRVGDDMLGREIRRRLTGRGMRTDLIQADTVRPTGFVEVTLDAADAPTYRICEPAAWDAIAEEEGLLAAAREASVLVFGSLAQRAAHSRATIQALWSMDGLKVFDVNLRPPFVDRAHVEASLHAADLVKLNEDELQVIADWLGITGGLPEAVGRLSEQCATPTVCVTRGAEGAVLWREDQLFEHAGYRVAVADTVGAGDAFLAGLLHSGLAGASGGEMLAFANRVGAYVAGQQGATPAYDRDVLRTFMA